MKKLLSFLLLTALSAVAYADIQDPPANDQGPTRKFSRGLANVIYGVTEIPTSIATINVREGNSTSCSYGVVKGVGRFFFRIGAGVCEMVTAGIPTYKGSYRPFYQSTIPWIQGGYEEFPPELGWDSKYNYNRNHNSY
jgi:putative exosortase-associated protein (TIGR04073 family)